ncbi:MAG: YlxR family protein [Chloroflexi bacterium]|nr:YlxR family protein [Chloroflexota bacterium]
MVKVAQPKRRKHIPQRTCVVCRSTADKRSLVRLVRVADEGVVLDLTGKRNGRGAYLCDQPACWDRALATDVLAKALRTTLSDTDRERIRAARPNENNEQRKED